MGYLARTHLNIGDLVPATDYNQGMDNEAQLKSWVDDASKASLTNNSGGNLAEGAVAVLDATADDSFTTSAVAYDRRILGVLFEAIVDNAAGLVALASKRQLVLVQGNVARGDFLVTSTTAGRAASAGRIKPPTGAFGVATTAYAGGGAGSVYAIIFGAIEVGLSAGSLYAGGGVQGGASVATTYKWNSQTDTTAAVAAAALSAARRHAKGGATTSKALFIGGYTGSESAVVDTMPFSTEVTTSTNSLPAARSAVAICVNTTDVYAMHGGELTVYGTTRYKANWGTETWGTLTAAVTAGFERSGLSVTAYGYECAGRISGGIGVAVIYRTQFSTDVETTLSAVMSVSASARAGNIESVLAGYIFSGLVSGDASLTTVTDKLTFATEAVSTPGTAAITTARQRFQGGGDGSVRAFLLGGTTALVGQNPTTLPSVIADQFLYATETDSAVSGANLPTATLGQAEAFGG